MSITKQMVTLPKRVSETGLSDYHSLVVTILKSHIPRLKPKVIKYRNYKNFDPVKFLADVRRTNFDALEDPDDCYDNFTNSFRNLVDKHAPSLREETVHLS